MELRTITLSLQGKSRTNNEDSYYADAQLKLMLVADGMGGHQAGEVASSIAVEAVVKSLSQVATEQFTQPADTEETIILPKFSPEEAMRAAFYYANDQIYSYAQERPELNHMGSTLTAAWVVGDDLYIGHVGDSRAYFFGNEVSQLTIDHSVAGELLREGGITKAEAAEHPKKHMLTRALGVEHRVEVDVYHYVWPAQSVLLLCSDGLSDHLDLESILDQIDVTKDKTDILAALVKMAEDAGSLDDITGVLAWHKALDEGGAV